MKIFVSGCPGIGKTTLVHLINQKWPGLAVDDNEYGYHPENDHGNWIINITKLREKLSRQEDIIFFSISRNLNEVGALPWDEKYFLKLPWPAAKLRIESRLKEGKNTYPSTPEEWEEAENCHTKLKVSKDWEVIDASLQPNELISIITTSIPL